MRFNQAAKAPLILEVGDEKLSVPKFTLRDQIAWAAELDASRADNVTKGMEPVQRFHLLNAFDVLPADLAELARRVSTPAGMDRICGTCLARAVPVEAAGKRITDGKPIGDTKAREIIEANAEGLLWLARELADIVDKSRTPEEKGEANGEGEAGDPLTQSESAA